MDNKTSITKKFVTSCIPTNLLAGTVLLGYSCFIINLSTRTKLAYIIPLILMILVAEFIMSPISNALICRRIAKMIDEWSKGRLDTAQKTELFKRLHKLPTVKQGEAFTYFFFCSIFVACYYHFFLKLNIFLNIPNLVACFFGTYIASLLMLNVSTKICSDYEQALVEDGIDQKILAEKKIFGDSYTRTFVLFCIVPIIWAALLFLAVFLVYYYNNVQADVGFDKAELFVGITKYQLQRISVILAINIVSCIVLIASFLKNILKSSSQLQSSMTHIIKNDIFTVDLTATDYTNEVSYNISLVNKVVLLFRSILDSIRAIGKTMIEPIAELSEISQGTASTSLEQSTGVKEILATMEETDAQTRNIADKISDVTIVAEETARNVETGFSTLKQNLDQMNEITAANTTTISGIRELGEKIGSIWGIVKVINDIADQTRIIAFNAELEASSAGESGRNFHIVANEVRRLATGITNSVEQIKDRITEIQHSSDNLIITSESGTEKIKEGQDLSEKLKEKFEDIRKSSEITVESANQIKEIIYQQSTAFDQIVATVRQISSGIENFSTSTATVNDTAKKLQEAANRLEDLMLEV